MAIGDLNNGGFINPFTKEEDERKARLRGFMGESVEAPQSVTNGQLTGFLGQPLAQEEINPTSGMLGSMQPVTPEVPTTPPATAMNTEVPVAPVAPPSEAIPGLIGGSMLSQPNLSNVAEFNQAMNSFLGQDQGDLQPVPQEADLRGIGRDEVVRRAASINEQAKAFGASGGEAFRESQDFVNRAFLANEPTSVVPASTEALAPTPSPNVMEFASPDFPNDVGIARTRARLMEEFGLPTISQIQARDEAQRLAQQDQGYRDASAERNERAIQQSQDFGRSISDRERREGGMSRSEARAIARANMPGASVSDKQRGLLAQEAINNRKSQEGANVLDELGLGNKLSEDAKSSLIENFGVQETFNLLTNLNEAEKEKYIAQVEALSENNSVGLESHMRYIIPGSRQLIHAGYNEDTGVFGYVNTETGKFEELPENAVPYVGNTSAKEAKLFKDNDALSTLEGEIDHLTTLQSDRALLPEGIEATLTGISSMFKTVLGKELNPLEALLAKTGADFQATLGQLRLDVLGPGVLTEQDAKRLIRAMGGDPRNPFADRETAVAALQKFIDKKKRRYTTLSKQYNMIQGSDLAISMPAFSPKPQFLFEESTSVTPTNETGTEMSTEDQDLQKRLDDYLNK